MTTPEHRPSVEIDVDHSTWLVGPSPELTDAERRAWAEGAQDAMVSDLGLESSKGGSDYRDYLASVLEVFAFSATQANVTFLRLRHQGDTPLPVLLELYSDSDLVDIEADPRVTSAAGGDSPAARFVADVLAGPGDVPTVGEISREKVGDSGWHRLVYWIEDPDDGVTGRVRHVRHFTDTGSVVVIRFGGLDPALTIEAIADVDALAAGVSIGGQS